MSWSIRVIGGNKEKAKQAVKVELEQTRNHQGVLADQISDAVCASIDLFTANGTLALDVESSGHIDSSGYGNMSLTIRTIQKSAIIN